MRIYNKMKNPAFFRYAGRGVRGVDLKPREESPELPAQRMLDTSVQKDLRLANIGVILSQEESDLLRVSLPADLMKLCTIYGVNHPVAESVPFSPPLMVVELSPEAVEPKPADKPIVFEPPAPKPTVDVVKEEISRTVAATAPAEQQARLDQFKADEHPAVATAAEKVQEQLKTSPPDGWMSTDDGEDPPVAPGQAQLDTSKYRGKPKYALFSEGVRRGLNVNPVMKARELRRLLAESDKSQPAGAK
jgi:hypothetical protein